MTREFPVIDDNDRDMINELYMERGRESKKEIYDDFIDVVKKYNENTSGQVIIDTVKLLLFEVCRCAVTSSKTYMENPHDYK
jgi:hypothetical protein